MSKYDFKENEDNDNFKSWMKMWSICFNLSLRDIERSVALYAFAYPSRFFYVLPYFIALKVKKKDLFEKLMKDNKEAHAEAKELVQSFIKRSETVDLLNKHSLEIFYEWHNAHCIDFKELGDNFKNTIQSTTMWGIDTKDLFKTFGNMIDLNIEK